MCGFTAHLRRRGPERNWGLLRCLHRLMRSASCGGNGYIEEWVTARLVRDAHIGVLWEGTSNIIALDAVGRAIGKAGAQRALRQRVSGLMTTAARGMPQDHRERLAAAFDRAVALAEAVARDPNAEALSRQAAAALYNATSAALLAFEGVQDEDDARRLLLSRMVLAHRLEPHDPLAMGDAAWERAATDLLLADAPVPLERARAVLPD